jgi:two-component system, NarL family, sensor kinase
VSATEELRDHDRVALGTAVLRVGLIPLLIVGGGASESVGHPVAFDWLLVVVSVYAAGVLGLRLADIRSPRMRLPARLDGVEAGIDFAFLCGFTFTSGGAFSELSKAFFVVPIIAAMRLQPRLTAAWALASVVGYVVSCILHERSHPPAPPDAWEELLTEALYLAWVGIGAVLLSDVLARRRRHVQALAAARGRLAAQTLEVEERERRRLGEALHDGAVQNLLVARQELADARRGDTEALARVDEVLGLTVDELRGEIREVHPSVLDHAGLEAAVRSLADEHRRRGAPPIDIDVDPAVAGRHDRLVHSLSRELLSNAVRHASATHIELRLADDGGRTLLEVRDDGRGIRPNEVEGVIRDGHIGLASWIERVSAVGGTLDIDSAPGRGAVVRATIPASPLP